VRQLRHLETNLDSTSVTRKKYRLVSRGNGQLSTRIRVILLRAAPVVGLIYRAYARYKTSTASFQLLLPHLPSGNGKRKDKRTVHLTEPLNANFTPEALRYGTPCQGNSEFSLPTHAFIHERNKPYLSFAFPAKTGPHSLNPEG